MPRAARGEPTARGQAFGKCLQNFRSKFSGFAHAADPIETPIKTTNLNVRPPLSLKYKSFRVENGSHRRVSPS